MTLEKPTPANPTSEGLADGIARAQAALLSRHNYEDGYWCADLKADSTIVSDTVMLLQYLGRGSSPKIPKLARHLLSEQLPDGGWPLHPGGPAEVSATVKAYWALKLAGYSAEEPALERARARIAALGGIHKVNTYSKLYMALFGQYDWEGVPVIPPEIMFFPKWFYFSIFAMSAWTRAIVVPLSIVWAKRRVLPCPAHGRLDELFPDSRRHIPLRQTLPERGFFSWTNFFLLWDEGFRILEGNGPEWVRDRALAKAESWIIERLQDSDGLGAIYPGIVNTILAMKAMDYSDFDPRLTRMMKELERLELDEGESMRMQPCFSPIWDTALALHALAEAGLDRSHPALVRSTEWLLAQEVRRPGDWKVHNPRGEAGGWAFEFANAFYPDTDDTVMVLRALRHAELPQPIEERRAKSFQRGLAWLLSMQSKSGGWGAFDRDNDKHILTKIPFADHNAMIDPPTADITGRVLDLLGGLGYRPGDRPVARALEMLREEQEADGSWYGRWGVNYLYGTFLVLRGLASIGVDMEEPWIRKAADWFRSVQREDGGWGESCETYEDPGLKGLGPSTPSQTAWAVMGLLAAAGPEDPAVARGIEYLLKTQREDGDWEERTFTGTGFPRVFYLEYTLYRLYFPLMALGAFREAAARRSAPAVPALTGD